MNAVWWIARRVTSTCVVLLLAGTLNAEGLLYQLPADGSWAKFDFVGKAVEPNDTKTTVTGTVKLSSVGTTVVEGAKCRWIELAFDAKRNDQPFTTVEKLLIPEKNLVEGQDPLAQVLKAWQKHSMIADGKPQELSDVQNADSPAGRQVRGQQLRPFLHGPFKTPELLDEVTVESKLGKRDCAGISAQERIEADFTIDARYVIRLHSDAPFGVVTWEGEMSLERNGMPLGQMTTKLTLSDFGIGATSEIPEAR